MSQVQDVSAKSREVDHRLPHRLQLKLREQFPILPRINIQ
jgi:hypothetical protein